MSRDSVITFSEYYDLKKGQFELDFVDVPVSGSDIKLFIDPYSLSRRKQPWYAECAEQVYDFFDILITLIRLNQKDKALYLLSGLHESNETRLGYSPSNQGVAIGKIQANKLYDSLRGSRAVETGVLKDIEECNLMVAGIDRDKISDMTTNIIKYNLIKYTQSQCVLYKIPIHKLPVENVFDNDRKEWMNDYYDLPKDINGKPIILVPKDIVRIIPTLNANEFYNHYVLNFLQDELYNSANSLCKLVKGVRKKPTKKIIKEEVTRVGDPKKDESKKSLKDYLYEFSSQHEEILNEYREAKNTDAADPSLSNQKIESKNKDRQQEYNELIEKLKNIPPGKGSAGEYHDFIVGAFNAIFYPLLTYPKKESPINDDLKRIDIRYINAATYGFFSSLSRLKNIPAPFIFVECKNYQDDVSNPECDQLATRFNDRRGRLGILTVRSIEDRARLISRCRAICRDGHGYIIPFEDSDIIRLLNLKKENNELGIDEFLEKRLAEIID